MTNQIPKIELNDGNHIPMIGLGTYELWGSNGVSAIVNAINNGYRLIDTAYNYENEGTVGEAIKQSSIVRENLSITSKLPGRYHTYDKAMEAIQESLYRASLDYYDLYLIHWPNPIQEQYTEAWQALVEAKKRGFIRSIGVCNFLPEHIEKLKKETGVLPSINQIELHPFFNQEQQRRWHEEFNVITQAWSPLARTKDILNNRIVKDMAEKHNKTVAQIILRWHYQHSIVTIPRSKDSKRQLENLTIFDFNLEDQDMESLDNLTKENGRLSNLDPEVYEEF